MAAPQFGREIAGPGFVEKVRCWNVDPQRRSTLDAGRGPRDGRTAAEGPDFARIDTHIDIWRDAPALVSALKTANWHGLSIVVSGASGDEPSDLEERLRSTPKVHRDSQGTVSWASALTPAVSRAPSSLDADGRMLRGKCTCSHHFTGGLRGAVPAPPVAS